MEYEPFVSEPTVEAGKDIPESMLCTRTGSVQSLNSTGARVSGDEAEGVYNVRGVKSGTATLGYFKVW